MAQSHLFSRVGQMALTIALTLLILICAANLTGCQQEDPKASIDHHLYLAESYVKQGQLKAAILEARTILSLAPGNPRAIFVIAKTMLISGDARSAEKKIAELVKTDPTNPDYAFSLVDALLKLKQQHSASFELTRYEKAGGQLTDQYYTLIGRSHLLAKDFEKAKQGFQRSLEILPDNPDALLGLAQTAHQENQLDERDSFLQKAIDSSPEHIETWLWKAMTAMSSENYPDAEEGFSNALLEMQRFDTMTATKYLTLNGLVQALIAQGKTDDALRYSETLSNSAQGKLQSSFKDAVSAFQTGDFSIAEKVFQEILEQAPAHGVTGTALGIISYSQGDFAEAESYLTQVLAGGDKVPDQAYKLLAVTRLKLDLAEECLDIISNGLKALGEDPDLYSIQGLAHLKLGNLDESRKSLNKALTIKPGHLPAQITMANLHITEKNYDDALQIYNKTLEKNPNSMVALKGVMDATTAQGKPENGIKILKKLKKKHPESINPTLILSASHLKNREYDDAIQYAQQASKLKPDNQKINHLLATTYYLKSTSLIAEKDVPGALKFVRKAHKKSPNSIPILLANIKLEMQSNNKALGEKIAQKFIQNNPENHQGFEILGDIQIRQSRFIEAVENLEKAWAISQNHLLGMKLFRAKNALRQDDDSLKHLQQWATNSDDDPERQFTLAMAYQESQQPAKAIEQYEAVLQRKPDHVVSLNNLAWLYQEAGHEDAERLAKKASELAPKSAAVIDTYGWILVLQDKNDAGIKVLKRALELAPKNKYIIQHLAEAQAK
ncbi:MAG: tetratricopeptide repeat protein [Pseudomonadales bacterium]|nr:tetratricopeptide repeat protein [Pseudomonadales bacterium]